MLGFRLGLPIKMTITNGNAVEGLLGEEHIQLVMFFLCLNYSNVYCFQQCAWKKLSIYIYLSINANECFSFSSECTHVANKNQGNESTWCLLLHAFVRRKYPFFSSLKQVFQALNFHKNLSWNLNWSTRRTKIIFLENTQHSTCMGAGYSFEVECQTKQTNDTNVFKTTTSFCQ